MRKKEAKVGIIGGGAAGMTAAISAGRILPGNQIIIIEKNQMLGRKILATGNGRCNFSNQNCSYADYNVEKEELIKKIFKVMDPQKTLKLFEEIGIIFRVDSEGRIYPYSEQATSIKEALETEIKLLKIVCDLDSVVDDIKRRENGFRIFLSDGGSWDVEKLIIATGGKAGCQYGSTGDGYKFAKGFGHTLKQPMPALVQLISSDEDFCLHANVRAKGRVTLYKGKKALHAENGEIQFTKMGLSGICIFNLSRYVRPKCNDFVIDIDLFPDFTLSSLIKKMNQRKRFLGDRSADIFLQGVLNKKLIPAYMKRWGIDGNLPIYSVSFDEIKRLAKVLKSWRVPIIGTKGWAEAQVTSGGINIEEINELTLESKLITGLFFAGEVLDVDGQCGGWNLQWAWSSGFVAGHYASL